MPTVDGKPSLAKKIEMLSESFAMALAEAMREGPLDQVVELGRVGGNRVPLERTVTAAQPYSQRRSGTGQDIVALVARSRGGRGGGSSRPKPGRRARVRTSSVR